MRPWRLFTGTEQNSLLTTSMFSDFKLLSDDDDERFIVADALPPCPGRDPGISAVVGRVERDNEETPQGYQPWTGAT